MPTIEYTSSQLVSRHRGTLPVLLTCPHNGDSAPQGVPQRTGQGLPASCQFTTRADRETAAITMGVAQRVLEIGGEAPCVVIARFKRDFIDANRPRECAFEVPAAQPFYDAYHGAVRGFVDDIRAANAGLGLLFDIHGTAGIAADPAQIYLGTSNGQTVARLLSADPGALSAPRSLRGLLTAAGYTVSPAPGQPERPELDGGHTVRTYGSSHADGLDAFQVEIDDELRLDADKRSRLIGDLAHAIVALASLYADVHTMGAFHRLTLAGAARRAGVLVLTDHQGGLRYLWVDTYGRLRIADEDPGEDSQAGEVVGTQA